MKRCQAVLIFRFQLRVHRENVVYSGLSSAVTGPVQRCATAFVSRIDIHLLMLEEVIERAWLVAHSSDMQDISSIHILQLIVRMHLFNYEPYQVNVAMIGREM